VFRKLNTVVYVDDLLFDKIRSKRLYSKFEVHVYRDDCVNGDDDYQYIEQDDDDGRLRP